MKKAVTKFHRIKDDSSSSSSTENEDKKEKLKKKNKIQAKTSSSSESDDERDMQKAKVQENVTESDSESESESIEKDKNKQVVKKESKLEDSPKNKDSQRKMIIDVPVFSSHQSAPVRSMTSAPSYTEKLDIEIEVLEKRDTNELNMCDSLSVQIQR